MRLELAFIGGVAFATSPIALYIADSLKILRDFFLVLFFFSLGASFNLEMLGELFLPTSLLGYLLMVAKAVGISRLPTMGWGKTIYCDGSRSKAGSSK